MKFNMPWQVCDFVNPGFHKQRNSTAIIPMGEEE
jgi:hypothetical protein